MATNNIKIFDQNKANMLTDEAYNTSTQRLNGVQQGIASSQLQNKTLYQVSLVAYAIGQMMQANGLNANDADAVSTFAGNLSSTIVQKILDKASTTEAKNFTVNNKFITPQTWKAAYDFMKADSNMVTSAVDDTHYITPKLLKEGAEKYGDKVRLEDGSLVSGIKIGEFYTADDYKTFTIYPVLNNKAYIKYAKDKNIYFANTANGIEIITSIELQSNFTIRFADENWIILDGTENGAVVFIVYHLESNTFIQKSKTIAPSINSGYYYYIQTVIPSFINITGNLINLFLTGADKNSNGRVKVAVYNKTTNTFSFGDISGISTGQNVAYHSFMNEKEEIACCNASFYSSSTSHTTNIKYVNNLSATSNGSITTYTTSSIMAYNQLLAYLNGVIYMVNSEGALAKYTLSDDTSVTLSDTKFSESYTILYINKTIIQCASSISLKLSMLDNKVIKDNKTIKIFILPLSIMSINNSYYFGFDKSKAHGNFYKLSNTLLYGTSGFNEAKKIKLLGFSSET